MDKKATNTLIKGAEQLAKETTKLAKEYTKLRQKAEAVVKEINKDKQSA